MTTPDQSQSFYRKGIQRFGVYRFVSRLSFYVPVLVVALLVIGRSYLEIGVLLAVYGLSTSFFGGYARRYLQAVGARLTLMAGEALKGLSGLILFAVIGRYLSADILQASWALPLDGASISAETAILVLAQILGGIGYSLAATADGTYLANIGKHAGPDDNHKHAESRSSSMMFISFLMAGVVGGVVAQYDPALPFFMTFWAHVAAFVVVSLLPEAPVTQAKDAARPLQQDPPKPEQSIAYFQPSVLAPLAYYSVFRALVLAVQIGLMPIILFVEHQLSIAVFGVVFASYTLTGFFAGRFYGRLYAWVGDQGLLGITVMAQIGSLLALAYSPGLAVVIAPLPMFFVAGMLRPYCLPKLNAAVDPHANARLIATAERLMGIFNAGLVAGAGAALSFGVSIEQIFIGLAALTASIGLGLGVVNARLRQSPQEA